MPGLSASRHAPPGGRNSGRNSGRNITTDTTTTHPRPPSPTLPPRTTPPAPITTITTTNPPTNPHPPPPTNPKQHDLARYAKIVRRLQWKLPFLAAGYHQAVHRAGAAPAAVAEAELMFKLDFFEFYMLIERALVHLLGVFGVDVPRGRSGAAGPAAGAVVVPPAVPGGSRVGVETGLAGSAWRAGRHRYHANVLAALDRDGNPLRWVLGVGEKMAAPLETYNLEKMLEVIFEGLEDAFKVAERFVCGDGSWAEDDTEMLGEDGQKIDWAAPGDEDQWEFMVDAMDWEAV
ncbi:hypothetical protein BT67DRAFT_476337 [Trichocladium antarcticum]|uniref:Fungal specific transcription factor n=1 Tax=Trichocladium antarcticum TaxID=1450529 RepID=A0AAN6ZHE4_9PEZI|nr:hypothetical protein BT67DRAFT_476337 [Trichocladium antarcticum]